MVLTEAKNLKVLLLALDYRERLWLMILNRFLLFKRSLLPTWKWDRPKNTCTVTVTKR